MKIVVLNFGGTSVGSTDRIKKVAKQKNEILKTHGSNTKIKKLVKKKKFINYNEGLLNTVKWFKSYQS